MPGTNHAAAHDRNVGSTERWLSLAAGTALIVRGMTRPSMASALLGLAGVALVQRGATGHCALFSALGVDTSDAARGRSDASRGHRSIHEQIESASEDSFPASDPPSWTMTSSGAPEARAAH